MQYLIPQPEQTDGMPLFKPGETTMDYDSELRAEVQQVAHGLKAHIDAALKAAEAGNTAAFKASAEKISQLVTTLDNIARGTAGPTPAPGASPAHDTPIAQQGVAKQVSPLQSEQSQTASPADAGASDLPPYSPEKDHPNEPKDHDEDDTGHRPSKGRAGKK